MDVTWVERYQRWQLGSRARYIATAAGLNALIVLGGMWAFTNWHPAEAPLVTAVVIALGVFLFGWVYYPRAKAKSHNATPPARTTHS